MTNVRKNLYITSNVAPLEITGTNWYSYETMKKKISFEDLIKDDFKDFIAILNKNNVDYCITGAFAVAFHSEPRSTGDIDFYVAHTKENSKKAAAAIREFVGSEIDENFFDTEKTVVLRMGIEPNQIELSNGLTGLKDDEIMNHRVKAKYGDLVAYYIGLDELLINKGIVRNMPHRGRKKGTDMTDYETLKIIKNNLMKK